MAPIGRSSGRGFWRLALTQALAHRAFLLDVDAPHWRPQVSLMTQGVDHPANLRQRHPVDGLRRDARRHGTGVAGDPSVGKQEQFGIQRLLINVLQRQSSPAAIVDDPRTVFALRISRTSPPGLRTPTALPRVDGFPALGVLRRLRHPAPRGASGYPTSSAYRTRLARPFRRGLTACSNHSSSTWCR